MKEIAAMLVNRMGAPQDETMLKYKEAKREAAKSVLAAFDAKNIDALNHALAQHYEACQMYKKRQELSEAESY